MLSNARKLREIARLSFSRIHAHNELGKWATSRRRIASNTNTSEESGSAALPYQLSDRLINGTVSDIVAWF